MHSAEETFQYMTEIRKLVRWIDDVCDGNNGRRKPSMRCKMYSRLKVKEIGWELKVEVKI